jgi:hypothetical protein
MNKEKLLILMALASLRSIPAILRAGRKNAARENAAKAVDAAIAALDTLA